MSATLPFDPTAPKELPKPGKRKPLNRAQIIEIAQRQSGNAIPCGCGCGNVLRPKCIDEHLVVRDRLPADRADKIDNRGLWNPECSAKKTAGEAGENSHHRAVRGERGSQRTRRERRGGSSIQGRKEIASPGFNKALRKRMDGSVVKI